MLVSRILKLAIRLSLFATCAAEDLTDEDPLLFKEQLARIKAEYNMVQTAASRKVIASETPAEREAAIVEYMEEMNRKGAPLIDKAFAVARRSAAEDPQQKRDLAGQYPVLTAKVLRWMTDSHSPSEVWRSPGESKADFQRRLKQSGIPTRPKNVDG